MKFKNLRYPLLIALIITTHLSAQPPTGYYDNAGGLSGASLKTALHNIIKDHTVITYNSIWTHFTSTDVKPNGKVWDMYSDFPGNPPYEYTFSVDQCYEASAPYENYCYNREHSWPRSWVGGDIPPMYTDLFHLYPTDAWVNELRSNFPFGKVNSAVTTTMNGGKLGPNSTAGYSGTVFEPIDEYKGDLARTYFYMATRYEDLIAGWNTNSPQANVILDGTAFPAFKPWFLDLLMSWHDADPVSQKEIDRNNAVSVIQGNRNPFIDDPGFVQMIWGDGFEPEPQYHVSDFSANTITLNWVDAVGPTLPEAYLVRMSDISFESISYPDDGIPVPNDFRNKNVSYGKQSITFGGLTPGVVYYFKIFSYRGSGSGIDYKTDGIIPQTSIKAK
jgi:endonuclease I